MSFLPGRQSCGVRRGPAPENASTPLPAKTFCCATERRPGGRRAGLLVELADFVRSQIRILAHVDFDEFGGTALENPPKLQFCLASRWCGKRGTCQQASRSRQQEEPQEERSRHYICLKSLNTQIGCAAPGHALRGAFEWGLPRLHSSLLPPGTAVLQMLCPSVSRSAAAPALFADGTMPRPARPPRPEAPALCSSLGCRAP